MNVVFKLIIKWLDIFPTKYMKYYEVYKNNKRAHMVDKDIAIAAAGTELILILDYCFRKHDRMLKVSKPLELTEAENETDWYYSKKKDFQSKTALCHAFGTLGGFEAMIRF